MNRDEQKIEGPVDQSLLEVTVALSITVTRSKISIERWHLNVCNHHGKIAYW